MGAVDPTYPLLPVAFILSAAMLLLVLLTTLVRQSWNLGVTFLCFWLFWESLTYGINVIIWSDNAELKLYVYCDIVTHLQLISDTVKPMATFLISRRLYLIASLQSVDMPDKTARLRDQAIEWTLGLVVPLIVAGPLYYISQPVRFGVLEGFGCTNTQEGSGLEVLIMGSYTVLPPLISVTYYYPKVVRVFYKQNRDVNRFLSSNGSVSRVKYLRILALASIDLLITLPFAITTIILTIIPVPPGTGFYPGWKVIHSGGGLGGDAWAPINVTYAELTKYGGVNPSAALAQLYFGNWSVPVLGFAIFALFGLTAEARASYWQILCAVVGWFGWKPTPHTPVNELDTIEFGERVLDLEASLDAESGSLPSNVNLDLDRKPIRSHGEVPSEGTVGDVKHRSSPVTTSARSAIEGRENQATQTSEQEGAIIQNVNDRSHSSRIDP